MDYFISSSEPLHEVEINIIPTFKGKKLSLREGTTCLPSQSGENEGARVPVRAVRWSRGHTLATKPQLASSILTGPSALPVAIRLWYPTMQF